MSIRRLAKEGPLSEAAEEEEEDGARGGEAGADDAGTMDMSSLYSLLQRTVKNQERESVKQEQRWRSVQIQLNNVRGELEMERRRGDDGRRPGVDGVRLSMAPPDPAPGPAVSLYPAPGPAVPSPAAWTRAAVPRLEEGDDIEQYLTTFERLAVAYGWPRAEWAVYLVPYLTGRARAAYVAMDIVEAMEYSMVKEAILAKYEISEEIYRQRFREPEGRPGETPKELYNRLKDLYRKWIKPAEKTVEEVGEILILEQYLRTLAPEVRVWVKEHNPATGQQAAELVEAFLAARRGPRAFRFQSYNRPPAGGKSGGMGGGVGHMGSGQSRTPDTQAHTLPYTTRTSQPRPPYTSPVASQPRQAPAPTVTQSRAMVICHFCNQAGHMIRDCPGRKAKGMGMCSVPRPGSGGELGIGRVQTVAVKVNGITTVALLDTGSTQTLVQPHLLDRSEELGTGQIRVCCVNGDEHVYPVAEIGLEVRGQAFLLTVGVVKGLSHPVVLGQDVLILPELVQSAKPVSMVVTRSQAKARETPEATKALLDSMPFSQTDISIPERVKIHKSRRQRRREKLQGTVQKLGEQVPVPEVSKEAMWELPLNFGELQAGDETLKEPFGKVTEIEGVKTGVTAALSGEHYFIREGLLYHQPEGGSREQLVVPNRLREKVLSLGHDIPWSGHLGNVKTLGRIAARFHWPGLYRDVQRYCKSCTICQLTSSHKGRPFPLQPLPIIGVPFQRMGMDIVGPLERTRSGHRFILVVCDYATRYPECFPLRKITASAIARALLQLFSRVGIPEEILTDQGTAFLSKTLKQVYSLLGIRGIRTTPYHPQTDGLVERYNRTLKSMLKKFVAANGKDWDQWLPYLLFAYREVPQASTGF